jgi:hypothetical protein
MDHLRYFQKETFRMGGDGNDLQAMRWVTENLHVVEHALRSYWSDAKKSSNNSKSSVSRAELVAALSSSAQTNVSGAEVDLLLSILDSAGDHRLQPHEYEKLLTAIEENEGADVFDDENLMTKRRRRF